MTEETQPQHTPGEVIAGKYKLVRELARGGMGVIWAAHHEMLKQDVAIKMLHKSTLLIPNAVERFTREAQAAAMLRSDHVVRVFDVGVLADGLPYIAMERMEGHDLSDELHDRGPLPVVVACDYVIQALDAIVEAHEVGIVHRDLKLGNLFLAQRSTGHRLKVLDFGISKIEKEGETKVERDLTSEKAILGSPGYMSPEQVRNAKYVDHRTDLWAIGVILHELLTGRALFEGEGAGEIFSQVIADPIPTIRSRRQDVPEDLERIVMRCLERDLQTRWQSALELREALAPFGPASSPSVRSIQTVAADSASGVWRPPKEEADPTIELVATGSHPRLATPQKPEANRVGATSIEAVVTSTGQHSTRRRWMILAGAAVVAASVVGVVKVRHSSRPSTAASQVDPPRSITSEEPAPSASALVVESVTPPLPPVPPTAVVSATRPRGPKPRAPVAPKSSSTIAPALVGRE